MQALEGVGVPQVESSKSSGIQDRIYDVVGVAQFLFHWGFLPAVIYLGIKKGGSDGLPDPTLADVLIPIAGG